MDDAQVVVAKEAGLCEKHGLDVELAGFSSVADLIKAIGGGQLTGVLGFINLVSWASHGSNLKVIGGAQRGQYSILVLEDSGIGTVADVKGEPLASQREGSTADAVLRGVTLKAPSSGRRSEHVASKPGCGGAVAGLRPQKKGDAFISSRS